MPKKVLILIAFAAIAITGVAAERTVGVLLNEEEACAGYTLFSPAYWYKTYLIDNEGRQIRSWESNYTPGLGGIAYLSRDAYLYRSVYLGKHPVLNGGGATGGVQKFDWDGNMVWNFKYSGDNYHPHHDIEVLPSGNVLMIVWEIKTNAEAIQAGADKSKLRGLSLYPDHIVEIEPVGADSGKVVWEWHSWDHLVQDYDASVSNYGRVVDHPELIDINARAIFISDFIHLNSVSYNEEFDQILVTSPMYNEVWVIDHSTTTEEAHGHTGGKYGKGGDILYRWGNPRFYDKGYPNDQKLFGGHDANWIDAGCPGAGNIIFFNNGSTQFDRPYSSVDEIVTPVDEDGNYEGTLPWGPASAVWTYTAPNPEDFFVSIICGAQRLPNGNTLTCDAPAGNFFEVTTAGDIVWRYIVPVTDSGPVFQGDSIYNNSVFKMRRYATDYPAFQGKDMTPGKTVELYPDDTIPGVAGIERPSHAKLIASTNLFSDKVFFSCELGQPGYVSLKIYNSTGQVVRTLVSETGSSGSHALLWDGTDKSGRRLCSGVYFVTLESGKTILRERVVLIR